MIVHKLTYTEQNETKTKWFGSEREAVVHRLELIKSGKISSSRKDNPIVFHDVPTDKKGLLAWLNDNQQG